MVSPETPTAPYAIQVKPTVELTAGELSAAHELAVNSFDGDFPDNVDGCRKPSDVLADVVTGNLAARVPRIGGPSLREGQAIERRYTVLVSAKAGDPTEIPAPEILPTSPPHGETTLPEGHGLIALASFSINASSRLPGELGERRRQEKMADPRRSYIAAGLYIAVSHFKKHNYVRSTPATPLAAALVALHTSGVYGDGSRKLTSYPYDQGHGGEEWALIDDFAGLGAIPTGKPSTETLGTDYIAFRQQRYRGLSLADTAAIIVSRHNARKTLANVFGLQIQ